MINLEDFGTTNATELLLDKSKIFNKLDLKKRKTKIICTLGNVKMMLNLIDRGMDVARLVSTRPEHHLSAFLYKKFLKEACKQRPDSSLALMFTTKGPEILISKIDQEEISLYPNDVLEITTEMYFNSELREVDENSKIHKIACDYDNICEIVSLNSLLILMDKNERDMQSQIIEINKTSIKIKVRDSGIIRENCIIHLPYVDLNLPTISETDENMIEKFVLREGVDMIAITGTRIAKDIDEMRDLLGPRGAHIKIIAKIDNVAAIQNYEQILELADGIMLARGRLCYELPEEKLFQAQKILIERAKLVGKPVITSTQMLESMVYNNRPTLAEVSDVANAVLDGSDAVLLTSETAYGKFPIESLEMTVKICVEAEQCIYYKNSFEYTRSILKCNDISHKNVPKKVQEVVCKIAVRTAEDLNAGLIIVITETGYTARVLAMCRPKQTILALCMSPSVIRQLKITRGVVCLKIPSFLGSENLISQSIIYAKENGFIKRGDKIVCILGENEETPDYVNIMKISTV